MIFPVNSLLENVKYLSENYSRDIYYLSNLYGYIRYFYPYYFEDNLQVVGDEVCSVHYKTVALSNNMEDKDNFKIVI